ncbi:MAG: hypothetical protein HRU34_09195 [Richelia sp.]|nr:hypothetical protein [Richelia sp.]
MPVDTFNANLQKDAKAAQLDKEESHPQPEEIGQTPTTPSKSQIHIADLTPIFPSPPAEETQPQTTVTSSPSLEQDLSAIADSLTRLEHMLASRLPPTDPLWYMNVLD